MWIKDPKTDKKSVTLTLLVVGVSVALFKLVASGLTVYGVSFETFPGVDFAAVVGALGALYGFRKHTDASTDASPPIEGSPE